MNSTTHHRGRGPKQLFHPFELAFCGRSGAGKTTLIEALISRLSPDLRVGYAKHDAHSFQMDQPGKDTWRAVAAGAIALQIHSAVEWAARIVGGAGPAIQRQLFTGCDLVLAEGYRQNMDLDKVLFIDNLESGQPHERVVAGITADRKRAGRSVPPELACNKAADAPIFHRDDVEGVATWIRKRFEQRIATRFLLGLVLTGGRSSRMGRDKAMLEFGGETQAARAAALLKTCCTEVFISARHGQGRECLGLPVIEDCFPPIGPMAGILSAQVSHPDAAWLVLGCDLPFVTQETLRSLLTGRNAWRAASAFTSSGDGLPEPLCAVWEPRLQDILMGALAAGIHCPRKVLLHSQPMLLDLPDPDALRNINSPEDLAAARESWTGANLKEGSAS